MRFARLILQEAVLSMLEMLKDALSAIVTDPIMQANMTADELDALANLSKSAMTVTEVFGKGL